MPNFQLPESSGVNAKRSAQAAKRRANWLAQVPDEFTLRVAADIWGVQDGTASAQLQKMVKHREIEKVTTYHRPARYRKVSDES